MQSRISGNELDAQVKKNTRVPLQLYRVAVAEFAPNQIYSRGRYDHCNDRCNTGDTMGTETTTGQPRNPKTFVHGYQPVLVLQNLMEDLRRYRIKRNLMDSHMERTLVSAALQLVMKSPDLQERWREEHAAVLAVDAVVTQQG